MDDQTTDRDGNGSVAFEWRWRIAVAMLIAVAATVFFWQRRVSISEYMYFRNHSDETIWAKGYTDTGFRKVQNGMARRQVIAILGTPLESTDHIYCRCGTFATQSWTKAERNGAYRRRTIDYVDDVVVLKQAGVVEPTEK